MIHNFIRGPRGKSVQALLALTGEGLDALDSTDDSTDLPTVDCETEPSASPSTPETSPSVTPSTSVSPTDGGVVAATATTTPPANVGAADGKLPLTGSSLRLPLLAGVGLFVVGGVLLVLVRGHRRRESTV